MRRRTSPPSLPAAPPRSAEEGAARVSAAVVSIFDKGDGHGADWRLLVESLFKAAFVMLDGLPEDERRKIARRVHEGSYSRTLPGPLGEDSGSGNSRPAGSAPAPSNTGASASQHPKPPR